MATPSLASSGMLKAMLRLTVALCCVLGSGDGSAQATGDFRSRQDGNWTAYETWDRYNGTDWVPATTGQTPTSSAPPPAPNVTIQGTHTVFLNGAGPYSVNNLIVESDARLWAGNGANRYITIYGPTLRCDGEIGSGPITFDQLSFNIDGFGVTIQGSGIFNASRLRKNFNAYATTNLTIAMDINLLFNTASSAQIYNNYNGVVNNFHVTINAGVTVNITGNGNISMDGVDGFGNGERGGSYTVNGTLNVTGMIYMTTDNLNPANQVRFTINNGGVVRAAWVIARNSGTAGHVLTINSGGTLELTGINPWISFSVPSVNNAYTLHAASTVIYSAAGVQNVIPMPGGYGNLHVRGTGEKRLSGNTLVKGSVLILNADGSPVLDVMSDNWQLTVRGNWTSYGEGGFEERNGLVLFDLNSAQTVNTTGGERFHNWSIAKGGAVYVSMDSDVTLVNNLDLSSTNARLDLKGNQLTLLNGAAGAITGTSGAAHHIRSEWTDNASRVRWDIGTTLGAHTIPFGAAGGLRAFTFNLTAGNAGQVTVSTYGTPANNLPWPSTPVAVTNLDNPAGLNNSAATVDRFWQVDVTGSPTASLTFRYITAERPESPYNDPLSLHAQRYDAATNAWMQPIEGQSPASNLVTVPGVTQFGPWTISAVDSPLPIELLAFTAEPEGANVRLDWATASERDNAYFTVLRSADGLHFVDLLRTAAVGDSWTRQEYNAVDDAPLSGISYYKLRQTDVDGAFTESAVVPVYRREGGRGSLSAYPNPTEGPITLAGMDAPSAIRILDAAGRVVMARHLEGAGERIALDVSGLAPGRYVALVEGAFGVEALPFMRQ